MADSFDVLLKGVELVRVFLFFLLLMQMLGVEFVLHDGGVVSGLDREALELVKDDGQIGEDSVEVVDGGLK